MSLFIWKGKNRYNEELRGEIKASDEKDALRALKNAKIENIKIEKHDSWLKKEIPFFELGFSRYNAVLFARQFSAMKGAGLNIVDALSVLYKTEPDKNFANVIKQLKTFVEEGDSLSGAMRKFPRYFDDFFLNMVEAGEAIGSFETVFAHIADYKEKTMQLKRKIKSAMTYPLLVLSFAVVITFLILIYVIPVFKDLFIDMGEDLPILTRITITISAFVKNNFIYIIIGLLIFFFFFLKLKKTENGVLLLNKFIFAIPVFGGILKKAALAKFARTMEILLKSDITIVKALKIGAKVTGSKLFEKALYNIRGEVIKGGSLGNLLSNISFIPAVASQIIIAGESSGNLKSAFEKTADFYDDSVQRTIQNLSSVIEPFLMIIIGIIIGFLVISMYLPVFQMAKGM